MPDHQPTETPPPLSSLLAPVVSFLRGVAETNAAANGLIAYIEHDLPRLAALPASSSALGEALAAALHEAVVGCAMVDDIGGPCSGPEEHDEAADAILAALAITRPATEEPPPHPDDRHAAALNDVRAAFPSPEKENQ